MTRLVALFCAVSVAARANQTGPCGSRNAGHRSHRTARQRLIAPYPSSNRDVAATSCCVPANQAVSGQIVLCRGDTESVSGERRCVRSFRNRVGRLRATSTANDAVSGVFATGLRPHGSRQPRTTWRHRPHATGWHDIELGQRHPEPVQRLTWPVGKFCGTSGGFDHASA